MTTDADVFAAFRTEVLSQTPLRAAITAAYRRPEPECVPPLLAMAGANPDETGRIEALARKLVASLRAKTRSSGVEGLIHEYSLSSQEGVALMCLAEALLRIPDAATRDALIRDKLAPGDWRAHLGHSPSLFVNAATWGLVLTGRLVTTTSEQGLSAALTRLIARSGEPIIRRGVDVAMRLMGEQFVTGRTIEEAIGNATSARRAASLSPTTCWAKPRPTQRMRRAISTSTSTPSTSSARLPIAGASTRGPAFRSSFRRFIRATGECKRARAINELLPRVRALAALAKSYDIGFNIDAEEADRLDLSLDILEALCFDPDLHGWNGLGFVIQAYGKRCASVIDWLIDLARRSSRRLMIRLVKGAYWDSEIKRAQVDGLDGFHVFTRKVHTDVSYLACARKLLRPRTRSFRNSPPTTPRRSPPCWSSPVPIFIAANTSSNACTEWASRSTKRWSAATSSPARAGSMRRSARTRRCSPISFAACSRTAPTPRSSTASPTRAWPWTTSSPTPWLSPARSSRSARRTTRSRRRATSTRPIA